MKSNFTAAARILTAITLLSALQSGHAQGTHPDTLRQNQLAPVVITATRSETRKDLIAQQVIVLDRTDIERTPANDLTDLVRKLAAVDIIQYPTLSSGVGIRGFRPQFSGLNQRTLLLIDGRPAGATNLSQINFNGIERIEVLKGPASALYGSQAMGGVINVVSMRSKGPTKGSAYAAYGSFQTLETGLQVGGNIIPKLDYDVSVSYFERGADYRIGKDNLLRNAFNLDQAYKYYRSQPEAFVDDKVGDGKKRPFTAFHHSSAALRFGYQLNDRWRMDVRTDRFQAKDVESPGDIASGSTGTSKKDIDRSAVDLGITGILGAHRLSLQAFASEENSQNYNLNSGGKPIIPFRSAQSQNLWKGIQLKDHWNIDRHQVTMGYDYLDASTNSKRWSNDTTERAPYQPHYALRTSAWYAQGLLQFDRLSIQPGIRFEYIRFEVKKTDLLPSYQAGKKTIPFTSPSLGLTYRLSQGLKLKGNIGRAFVTADAYSVAGYNEVRDNKGKIAVTAGNPNLKHESSLSWDLTASFYKPKNGLTAEVTYFQTSVFDRITKSVTAVNEVQPNNDIIVSRITYVNATKAQMAGLETQLQYDLGVLADYRYSLRTFFNSTSYFKAKEEIVDQENNISKRDIHNVAKNTFNYGIEYDNNKWWSLRLTGRTIGWRKDIDYNDAESPVVRYPSYSVLDLAVNFKLGPQHQIMLKVSNLTDENYYEKRGYNLPGRAASLRYQISF
ncbi:TonB-dependent receptor plug domain-containing protein [Dyadobacter tibetensis]|uniref:TonB-dependent receptor plug domain-containing protein n=1 Tax=Dyadobacter tibetensis TaxID=1211851 RepID=UPI00046ECF11|nr:TonB-dependent receptor [Dyadobacter tibetensis]